MKKKAASKTIKGNYFHGIGTLIANATGYSEKYVRDVLNGEHDDRTTTAVKKIKDLATLYMTPVNDAVILEPQA